MQVLKNNWQLIMILILGYIIAIPNIKIYWQLIDDGYNVQFTRILTNNIASLNLSAIANQLFESVGRFRPVFWLYHLLAYLIGGNTYQIHRIIHLILFFGIIYLIFAIVTKISSNKNIALFSALIFALTPTNFENWVRLGTSEPLVTFFSLFAVFVLLFSKEKVYAVISMVLLIFTKEISFFVFPPLFFLYKFKNEMFKDIKNQSFLLRYIALSFVLGMFAIMVSLLVKQQYSENYSFVLSDSIKNLIYYFDLANKSLEPFLFIGIASFILRNFYLLFIKERKIINKLFVIQCFFVIMFLSYCVVQSPWKYAIERYLMPGLAYLSISLGIEFYYWTKTASMIGKKYFWLKIVAIVLLIYWAIVNTYQLYSYTIKYATDTSFEAAGSYIANNVSENTDIYVNLVKLENTEEFIIELNIHLKEYWGRNDLVFKYIEEYPPINSNHIILSPSGLPRRYDNENVMRIEYNELSFRGDKKWLVITTPLNIVKQLIKKTPSLIKGSFSPEGLFTFYHMNGGWNIYVPKK